MQPYHSNFGGKIHGGFILSLMDQVAFACASKHSGQYCVTASVDTVDFLAPVEIGELLTLKASVNYVGNTSMWIGIRVESENIQDGYVKHCNSSYFTMVDKDHQGKNVPVPGLFLRNTEDVRRFVMGMKRKERQRFQKELFNPDDFDPAKYQSELQKEKVQLVQ
jgi:uncharacterized protein (TIGR00369 family)